MAVKGCSQSLIAKVKIGQFGRKKCEVGFNDQTVCAYFNDLSSLHETKLIFINM